MVTLPCAWGIPVAMVTVVRDVTMTTTFFKGIIIHFTPFNSVLKVCMVVFQVF